MINIDGYLCDLCGACVAVCPVDCIELTEFDLEIDNQACIDCNACVKICPFAALTSEKSGDTGDEKTL